MELRDVDPVRLARAVISPAAMRLGIVLLLLMRALMAGLLPLSADEAYYWLWSRHLAAGYYDHPPAIAFLIRAGTVLFGDTPFGVRVLAIPLSALTSWFIWDAARTVLDDAAKALFAALLFNLTLMIGVEMLAATPDMPSIATSAAFLWALARLQKTADGRWWLAAGVAAGLGLLAKYSALFLGVGAALWLIADARQRRWLLTPWPWAGGLLAVLLFLPNLVWQAHHDWVTFAFQFGRIGGGHLTGRFLAEFFGAQIGLATPLVFLLGCLGLFQARRRDTGFLAVALMAPALCYFLIHALHDRVQGNWPSFLYPAFCLLAAGAAWPAAGTAMGWRRWVGFAAAPLALAMLLLAYGQALTGLVPLKGDPLARLLGAGFKPVADSLESARRAAGAGAVITSDYETTAWLRFYEPGLKVVQVTDSFRYPDAPSPSAALMHGPLLYFVEKRRDRHAELEKSFSTLVLANELAVSRHGDTIARYEIYLAEGMKMPISGRMP